MQYGSHDEKVCPAVVFPPLRGLVPISPFCETFYSTRLSHVVWRQCDRAVGVWGSGLGGAELNFRPDNYIAGLSAVLLGHVKTQFWGCTA